MRRRFGGRQPLCGTGVTSWISVILMPRLFSARTADSRPGPGPLIRTSRFLTPCSCATRPAFSAATCAANGVDLREPLKPAPPDVAHDRALPCRSVIVMIVLLNEAWMCAMPSATFFLTFLRTRVPAFGFCGDVAILWLSLPLLARRRRLAHARARLLRTLAGARVGARALTAHRQPAAMPDSAVAAQVHQPLDAHRHLAAEIAFDGELLHLLAQPV